MTLVLREAQDSGPLNNTARVHLYMEFFQTVNTTELCDRSSGGKRNKSKERFYT